MTPMATAAHYVTLAGAFTFWVALDRHLWFFGDEWDFLVQRGLAYAPASHHSIWFPHNEHWSTLPILLWRVLFNLWHLGTYWPYLLPVLFAHVAIMHLLWRICRRSGADPWISVATVGALGFLGAGAEDLAWAFQIGFVGAVFFGLLAIELLDTAPLGTRRQVLCIGCLIASLMCSTVGDAMVVGTASLAFATLPRRRALAVVVPPVAVYVAWFAVVGRLGLAEHSDRFTLATFTNIPGYLWSGLSSALGQSFNLQGAGAAVLVGLAAWTGWHARSLMAERSTPLALVVAVIAFYVLAALGRDASTVSPAVSRYIYIAFALLVPLVAKLLTSLATWPAARWGAVVLLGFTALGNVSQAQDWVAARRDLTTEVKVQLAATGELLESGAKDVSGPGAAPVAFSPNLSVGTILRLATAHRLPRLDLTSLDLINARAVLAVGDWDGLQMTLSHKPLSSGHFDLKGVLFGSVRNIGNGCTTFTPLTPARPLQVWLSIPTGERSASVLLSAPPTSPGNVNYAGALLVPPRPPSSSVPVEVAVPADGSGYLNDNYGGAELVVTWPQATVLTACDLVPRQAVLRHPA